MSSHLVVGLCLSSTASLLAMWSLPILLQAQGTDPAYQTRQSQCRHEPPPGTTLTIRRAESVTTTRGYTSERVLTFTADASGTRGGDLLVCTEYGRVEIADSDDDQVRLQIRMEGFGEGSTDPGDAAVRVLDESTMHTHLTRSNGRLMVKVWHSTLGFTTPGAQPAWISIRLLVPRDGAYHVTTQAFHGAVAIRRLTLAGATLRGNVGEKLKGIPGFLGTTELDNVELAGDVSIDNLVGIPGIRAPITGAMAALAAPIQVKARVGASCRLTAVTNGNINIAIQPAPDLAVRAEAKTKEGRVNIMLDRGVAGDSTRDSSFSTVRSVSTADYATKPLKISVFAASGPGTINISSIPAAPLPLPLPLPKPPGRGPH